MEGSFQLKNMGEEIIICFDLLQNQLMIVQFNGYLEAINPASDAAYFRANEHS